MHTNMKGIGIESSCNGGENAPTRHLLHQVKPPVPRMGESQNETIKAMPSHIYRSSNKGFQRSLLLVRFTYEVL